MNDDVRESLKRNGFTKYGVVPVRDILLYKEFYEVCATNQCGKFNTNWSCPPGVGGHEDLVASFRAFDQALVVQSLWSISDSFDIEGMLESGRNHNDMMRALVDDIYPLIDSRQKLTLSAGACTLCKECSYIHGKPCPIPERAFGALEAYGVDVGALLEQCDLKYNNGPNTVSYVGVILY